MTRQKTKPAGAKQPVETVVEQPVTPGVETDEDARRAMSSVAGSEPVTQAVSPTEIAVQQGHELGGAATISPVAQAAVGVIASKALAMAKSANAALGNIPAITVVGPAKGRWRAGRHFTPEATVIALEDLLEGQLEAITADPELTVVAND